MRGKRYISILAVFIFLFLSCSPLCAQVFMPYNQNDASSLSDGDKDETLLFGGRFRSYRVHVPSRVDKDSRVALVIVLHGGGGNAANAQQMTLFNRKADQKGFIVVYPNGTGIMHNRLLTWNAGNCCGYAFNQEIDDVGFIRAVIARLKEEYAIDPGRVFVTGISNGGKLAYRLACELSGQIAAIAPVAGSQDVPECRAEYPVSVIIFHGTADKHVLYEGGKPEKSFDKNPRVDSSVSSAVSFWVQRNGCSFIPSREEKGNIIHDTYSGCENGTGVEVYTIKGGGHSWPGGKAGRQLADAPSQELSANDLMWDFFESHPRQ